MFASVWRPICVMIHKVVVVINLKRDIAALESIALKDFVLEANI